MDAIPHIPAFRFGRTYESLDRSTLSDFRRQGDMAEISQVNAGLIRRDLKRRPTPPNPMTVEERCACCAEAARRFLHDPLPVGADAAHGPDDYVRALSSTGGLPHALVRANMAKIHRVLSEMPSILGGLTRGLDLTLIDRGIGHQDGRLLSFFPAARTLGVVLPSNSPGVNSLWLPAVALGVPVALKPGREDPWTPWRILQALLAAGCPPELLGFYPTDHEGADAVAQGCDRAILFGDASTVERHAANPAVSVHGPGYSKVLIGEDRVDEWPEWIDVLADSVVLNSGRSCVNASTIVAPRRGAEIAAGLAERLSAHRPRGLDDPAATLAGFANPAVAQWTDQQVEAGLAAGGAEDACGPFRDTPRLVERDGVTYLLPTVVRCLDRNHPLARTEFLFPFASVVEVPQSEMLDWIGPTLVGSLITRDSALQDAAIRCPHIDRLNLGAIATTAVAWDQPHEGNLFEFLYRRRAVQREDPGGD